jgi:hypothetical protein
MDFPAIVKKPYQKEKLVKILPRSRYEFVVDLTTSNFNAVTANDLLIDKTTNRAVGKIVKGK